MLRGMVTYLIENGSIETTLTRAKEIRAVSAHFLEDPVRALRAARQSAEPQSRAAVFSSRSFLRARFLLYLSK